MSVYTDWDKASKLLDKVEETLVFDCTVAAEWPGFPEVLRDQVHAAIVARAISCLPINAKVRPFIDTLEQQVDRLHALCWDLHTIFHDVSQHPGFSDDPRSPLRALFTLGEERREELVAKPPEELP